MLVKKRAVLDWNCYCSCTVLQYVQRAKLYWNVCLGSVLWKLNEVLWHPLSFHYACAPCNRPRRICSCFICVPPSGDCLLGLRRRVVWRISTNISEKDTVWGSRFIRNISRSNSGSKRITWPHSDTEGAAVECEHFHIFVAINRVEFQRK